MAAKGTRKRLAAAVDAVDAANSPMARLDAARRLRELADELEVSEVRAAREAGTTWLEIAACYGLTKQGAQQRFRVATKTTKPQPG